MRGLKSSAYRYIRDYRKVAPARVRGLKCGTIVTWCAVTVVAPARVRGLKSLARQKEKFMKSRTRKGAWIEILNVSKPLALSKVAPARVRGLKYQSYPTQRTDLESHPQGCVD